MTFMYSILFVAFLLFGLCPLKIHTQAKPDFPNYEYCVTEDGAFGLYKPKGWNVGTQRYPNGKRVFVTDERNLSYVNMTFLENIEKQRFHES